jgi:hypothetical protein
MVQDGGTIPLRQHFEALLAEKDKRDNQRFEASQQALTAALIAQETAVRAAMTAAEKAVTKAEAATEKRFESVNEFRKTLSDQTSTFPNRIELQALAERVSDLATRMDRTEGKSTGLNAGWAYLIGAASFVALVITIFVALKQG